MMKRVPGFKGGVWLATGAAACMLLAGNAAAAAIGGLSVIVQPVAATPGDVGDTFEVDVQNTGLGALSVAGFGFGLSIGDTDITLEDATDVTTIEPYIFAGNSLFGPDILVSTDGQNLLAEDITADFSAVTLNPGDIFGLGLVSFNVAPGATPGTFAVTLNSSSAATNFSDAGGNSVPIGTLNNGSITVAPEPSSWLLLAGGLAALLPRRLRRN